VTYKFHSVEKVWQKTVYDEEMEVTDGVTTDFVDDEVGYYWITSEDRDDVLKVMDFCQGEDIITELKEGNLEDFEDAVENYEYTEIRKNRPPQ